MFSLLARCFNWFVARIVTRRHLVRTGHIPSRFVKQRAHLADQPSTWHMEKYFEICVFWIKH